jgi:hypothetical protein
MMPRTGLPEHTRFRDDGCSLQPACLSCSLSACRYDVPPGVASAEQRRARLDALIAAGHSLTEAAHALDMNPRSAYRLTKQRMERR